MRGAFSKLIMTPCENSPSTYAFARPSITISLSAVHNISERKTRLEGDKVLLERSC